MGWLPGWRTTAPSRRGQRPRGCRGVRAALAGLTAAALLPGGARAQNPAGDSLAGDTIPVLAHRGITVRALRTPVAMAALPFSVTVRRPADYPPVAGLGLGGALRAIPGLQIQDRHNDALGDRIVMRGFGARSQFGVRGVHVLVDGIPATMPDGQTTLNHLDLPALQRAEVLRGPAAAAYGNAAGGVLLLTTTPPPASGVRQQATALAGSDGLLRFRVAAGGAGGSAGWTGAATREWRDGYRPHSGTDRWQLTGRFDAPLAGGFLRVVAHGVSYDADNPGSLTLDQYLADPHQAQAFNVAQRTGEEGRHGQVGLAWERSFDALHLDGTVYALARSLENPIPPTIIDLERGAGGVRLLARGGAWSGGGAGWAVGVDAALLDDDRRNFENVDGDRGALTLDQTERVSNFAVHGQAMVPVAGPLGLFLAARYDRVAFSADDRLIAAGNPDDSGERTMDAVSPTAGLRLDVSAAVGLFANVATAFETPTTTELVNRPDGAGGFNQALEPQRTVSWEVGARASVASRLGIEASAYLARVEDALVPFEVASAPGRQYFRNAAGARHRGLELVAELAAGPVDVLAAFAWTEAEFTDYTAEDQSYDGLTVPGVRPWTVELSLLARPHRRLAIELQYRGAGPMAVDDANDFRAPEHHLFDLRAAARQLRVGGWRLRPWFGLDNLLDETYVASVVPNAFGGRFFEPGPGRALYAGIELGHDRR